ncbi:MAG: DUF4388 domain-containing protein, partial [Myxococcota bacterium]|nr:DUF4388 domain-containing protein [Myxococcota bacterium]
MTLTTDGEVYIVGDALRNRLAHASGRYRLEGTSAGGLEFSKANEFKALRELANPIMLSGRLDHLKGIVDIVSLIAIAKYNANLVVLDQQHRYVLSFLDGRVRNAQSSDPTTRLGEIIYRSGAITREQLDKSLVDAQHFGRPIGNYLVEQKLVSQSQLLSYVDKQVRTIFQAAVAQQQGQFFLTTVDS